MQCPGGNSTIYLAAPKVVVCLGLKLPSFEQLLLSRRQRNTWSFASHGAASRVARRRAKQVPVEVRAGGDVGKVGFGKQDRGLPFQLRSLGCGSKKSFGNRRSTVCIHHPNSFLFAHTEERKGVCMRKKTLRQQHSHIRVRRGVLIGECSEAPTLR